MANLYHHQYNKVNDHTHIRIHKIMTIVSKFFYSTFIFVISFSLFATELKVGDQAPNFRLQATNGDFYQLSDYQGKQSIILAWYPMANTRGCTFECKSLVEQGHLIREYNVSYFMASVDPLDDNRDFAKKTGADFPMLSDPTKAIAKAYDVLNLFKVASRVTFYISKQGKILKIDDDISPKTAAEDIAKNLQALNIEKAVTSHANKLSTFTVEELRIEKAIASIPNVANEHDLIVKEFAQKLTDLNKNNSKHLSTIQLSTLLNEFGQLLWLEAKSAFNKKDGFDDRSLYWARLKITKTLRQSPAFQSLSTAQQLKLLWRFELHSRGQYDITFDKKTDKKLLLLGFDPFLLDKNIQQNNPSGVTVLALDNTVIKHQGKSIEIETVIIPVRFADFDQGIIEQLLTPYLKNNSVDMIITVSMGRAEFDLEHFPGLRRSATAPDNLNVYTGANAQNPIVPLLNGKPLQGPEFIEFSLPVTAMQKAKGRYKIFDNRNITIAAQSMSTNKTSVSDFETVITQISVQGSGGGYLSNEISYRSLRLRDLYNPTLSVGHIHTPRVNVFDMNIQKEIVAQIQRMIAQTI